MTSESTPTKIAGAMLLGQFDPVSVRTTGR